MKRKSTTSQFINKLQKLRQDICQEPFTFTGEVPHLCTNIKNQQQDVLNKKTSECQSQSSSMNNLLLSGFRFSELTPEIILSEGNNSTTTITTTRQYDNKNDDLEYIQVHKSSDFIINKEKVKELPQTSYHKALLYNMKEIMKQDVVFVYDNDILQQQEVCGCGDLVTRRIFDS